MNFEYLLHFSFHRYHLNAYSSVSNTFMVLYSHRRCMLLQLPCHHNGNPLPVRQKHVPSSPQQPLGCCICLHLLVRDATHTEPSPSGFCVRLLSVSKMFPKCTCCGVYQSHSFARLKNVPLNGQSALRPPGHRLWIFGLFLPVRSCSNSAALSSQDHPRF